MVELQIKRWLIVGSEGNESGHLFRAEVKYTVHQIAELFPIFKAALSAYFHIRFTLLVKQS